MASSKAETGTSTSLVGVPNFDYPQTYKIGLVVEMCMEVHNRYTLT